MELHCVDECLVDNSQVELGLKLSFVISYMKKYDYQVLLTTRNLFIANLAISDLLLCTFTMPLTLMDLLTMYWPLGEDMVSRLRMQNIIIVKLQLSL